MTHALAWINFENMLYESSQAHTHKMHIEGFCCYSAAIEITILSEVSQKEKNKYCMISLICGI